MSRNSSKNIGGLELFFFNLTWEHGGLGREENMYFIFNP